MRAAFIVGLLAGGVLLRLTARSVFDTSSGPSWMVAIPAGLLVGFGTQLGNGCTSRHGVCAVEEVAVELLHSLSGGGEGCHPPGTSSASLSVSGEHGSLARPTTRGDVLVLWLAHDGSINADWLSHYAIHLGRGLPAKEVRAVFVEDGALGASEFFERIDFLRRECAVAGLTFSAEVLPLRGSVAETLRAHIPPGTDTFVLCGARTRKRNFRLLEGTVSEHLLAAGCFNVIAIRIVHPGVLGNPRRILLPVMGHPRGFRSGMPLIRLLGDGLERIDVVMVLVPPRVAFSSQPFEVSPRRTAEALIYVERVKRELTDTLRSRVQLDGSVLVAADPAYGIVLAAKQHKSQLICLGATERNRVERWVSGVPAERVLRNAPCDVAIYRGVS